MQRLSDNQLHELAHKRVDFRRHLVVYLIVNTVIWLIWFTTGSGYMWPIWPTAGWGIGLLFHFIFDYLSSNIFSEEEEFKKLKKKTPPPQSLIVVAALMRPLKGEKGPIYLKELYSK